MAEFGLASPELIRELRPGAVFLVKDEAIDFPEDRIPGATPRTEHEKRRVIVVNDPALGRATSPRSLLVVPCTASQRRALSPWHFEIPQNEAAFTGGYVVALAHLVQPILKSDLEKCVGVLSPASFVALQAKVAQNLGLTPSDPPAASASSPGSAGGLPEPA